MRIWLAERRWLRCSIAEPHECVSLELPRVGDSSGNSYTHRGGEEIKPRGGFFGRNKGEHQQDEGFSTEDRFYTELLFRVMVRVVG